MIPLADNHPTHHTPWLTYAILGACVAVFLWQVTAPLGFEYAVYQAGFIPAYTLGGELDPALVNVGWAALLSSMFMHGDVAHLAGNMLYLWVFGDNIENALYRRGAPLNGRGRFAVFYLLGGVAAAVGHGMLDPASPIPMIGASGAISAVLGAYFVLYPRQPITVALPYVGITEAPAWTVLGLWFGYQLLHGLVANPEGGGVAFWAHIFGFVAGMLLIKPFGGRRRPVLWR